MIRRLQRVEFPADCRFEPSVLTIAKAAGILCSKAGTANIVDAAAVMAATLSTIIWTSDPDDIRALIDAQDVKPAPVVRTI
ncbi:hypothetical protein [Actinacidiphila oryziradicis]|uniref:hypothetical protein n=1 Tax=Actinacidiphila oryziradicis TaxID=2571141 RepID=UPI001FE5896F|nr:hypothetical protein [Actinacidiphila oryziradicis]